MVDEREWEVSLEAAWVELRGEVADVLAGLGDGECVLLEWGPELLEGCDDDESAGAPYVQATGYAEGRLRIEAVSNYYLDESFGLDAEGAHALSVLGWREPTYAPGAEHGEGSANFWFDLESRHADLAAVMLVQALREAYGCLHPTLLATVGVYGDVDDEPDEVATDPADDPEEVADFDDLQQSWPASPSELQAAVLEAVGAIRGEPAEQDPDGDVPIRAGQSLASVRVMSARPAVELFAELVIGLEDADAQVLARELNILNRNHHTSSFYAVDGMVLARQWLIAVPFVPLQLKIALETFCSDLDETARDLVERVGGHRFFDAVVDLVDQDAPQAGSAEEDALTGRDDDDVDHEGDDPAVDALIEMLRDGRLPTRSVIELFGADRTLLVEALSNVRGGGVSCHPVGEERVLESLRRAVRAVARSDAERARAERDQPGLARRLSVLDVEEDGSRRRA